MSKALFALTAMVLALPIVGRSLNRTFSGILAVLLVLATVLAIFEFGWLGIFIWPAAFMILIVAGITTENGELIAMSRIREREKLLKEAIGPENYRALNEHRDLPPGI